MYQANTLSNPATLGFPRGLAVKNPPVMQKMQETWVQSRVKKIPQRRAWQPTPVLLPGKSNGWRSLVAAVHGVTKSRTPLSIFTFTFHFHALEKEMAIHCSTLAWKIPWMEEPGGLQSMGLLIVGHD